MSSLKRRLFHIHVVILSYLNDCRITLTNRGVCPLHILPSIYSGILVQFSAINYLVPSGHLFAVFLHNLAHSLYKVVLNLVCRGHTLSLHKLFTPAAVEPILHSNLISSNVDIVALKNGGNLFYYVVQNLVILLPANTEDISNLSLHTLKILIFLAKNLRHTGSNCLTVSRKVNFGNNLYMPLFAILYKIFHLLLCVEASIALVAGTKGWRKHLSRTSPRTLLG